MSKRFLIFSSIEAMFYNLKCKLMSLAYFLKFNNTETLVNLKFHLLFSGIFNKRKSNYMDPKFECWKAEVSQSTSFSTKMIVVVIIT